MGTQPCILVVEPNQDLREILEIYLGSRGYRVVAVPDGAAALEQALRDPPALVIGEHPLPLPDGTVLCHALRAAPATADVPFLVLTGRAMPEQIEEARRTHPCGVMVKPLPLAALADGVADVLAGRFVPTAAARNPPRRAGRARSAPALA